MKSFTCYECGGKVILQAKAGRTREVVLGVHVPIPADFKILTCQRCNETYMDHETSERLDKILRPLVKRYEREQREKR